MLYWKIVTEILLKHLLYELIFIEKPSTEVSFFGNEWIGYDNLNNEGNNNGINDEELLAVLSHREIYNISFRTNFSKNSLLFVAGDSKVYF